jgi:glycosyltransferase involved in cell wall biosynthesis
MNWTKQTFSRRVGIQMKKVVILFNGIHLSYSPTIIGLYDLLSEHFDVTILPDSPREFDNKPLAKRTVVYKKRFGRLRYRINCVLFYLHALFDKEIAMLKKHGFRADVFYDFKFIRKHLTERPPDFIIAVDFKKLFHAQLLGRKVEFVSLEISPNDAFRGKCDLSNINSVIIQTRERYEHLFKDREFKTFFIQNAPVYTPSSSHYNRQGLVYCGTAWNEFGFYHCLEFLRQFPEYTLNVRGALLPADKARVETDYRELLSSKRLLIDSEYLDDSEVVDYLRRFRIGFCFYNFEVESVNHFNYYSAPSGKVFKYMAAGVPVIGQDILGLQPVREFDCGVLIQDLNPASIKKAIEQIEDNFEYYSQNCLKAAEHYSLDKAAKPFIEHLAGE